MEELILGKETRRSLEQAQKAFDGLLYRYSAQAKSKEPSSLREDAFQLHEARRAYLKASMDFSVMAPQLRMALDKVMVRVFSDQWREMRSPREISNSSVGRWGSDIERVRGWSREIENGERTFRRELQSARKQIEDNTELRIRPSRELEDYAVGPSSSIGSKGPSTASLQAETFPSPVKAAKQGWLNLRTLAGKPTRTIWLRRWFFVKNGIFGWLVQGARSGGVEESDRIGVLLCSIRPSQSEERRFVFEVKTKDLTIILQAETQKELIEWMRAFEVAKRKALEDPASTDSLNHGGATNKDPAFAISSPSAPEFAASATDSGSQQFGEDGSAGISERVSTLPLPGLDNLGLANRTSSDISTHRRSTGIDRDIESGRDHAARIIQKLDLHRKSAGGPQLTSNAPGPPPSSPGFGAGGIASLIAASHNVMPVGPIALPQTLADNSNLRISGSTGVRDLPSNTLAPNTLVNVPAPTNLSAIAVVVSGERGIGTGRADASGGMPSGVMANVWGSSNWGYLNRLERGEVMASQGKVALHPANPQNPPLGSPSGPGEPFQSNDEPKAYVKPNSRGGSPAGHRKSISLPADSNTVGNLNATVPEYPNYYPIQLKTQDAQFRLLFPNVPREERLLLVFRATWSLNDQQEFPGRVYVTGKDVYFYSHHLGLILISGISLSSVSEVTAAPGRDYDLLFIHLKKASSNTGSTRITVKTFLEPLRLLQRRLNLLVTSCSMEQPPDVESVLKSLIKLEQDDPASSPSLESWEDLATATIKDESNGRHMWQKNSKDLRAAVIVDRGLYGDSTRSEELKDATKIKLPRHPVEYIPTGMDQAVVEKVFDISPKALFHVMFGDRSAVWQLLYHERRAQS